MRFTSDVVLGPDRRPRWKKGGEKRTFTGRQLWWSLHDPDFKELLDTRGKNDVESKLGEWTRVECICEGKTITIKVNDHEVNHCYNAHPAAGKVLRFWAMLENAMILFLIEPRLGRVRPWRGQAPAALR